MLKTQLIGRLTRDAEWKRGSSSEFLAFDVAVNTSKDRVVFVNCTINDIEYANKLCQFLLKGTQIHAEGLPIASGYITRDGKAMGALRLMVNRVLLLGSKKEDEQGYTTPNNGEFDNHEQYQPENANYAQSATPVNNTPPQQQPTFSDNSAPTRGGRTNGQQPPPQRTQQAPRQQNVPPQGNNQANYSGQQQYQPPYNNQQDDNIPF